MTDIICLQCWAMLHQIKPAHADHGLYHPPSKHPVHLPAADQPDPEPAITYPDSDHQ